MKFLKCILCDGEIDIVGNSRAIHKKIKCRGCGFSNNNTETKSPEVVIIRKRFNSEDK